MLKVYSKNEAFKSGNHYHRSVASERTQNHCSAGRMWWFNKSTHDFLTSLNNPKDERWGRPSSKGLSQVISNKARAAGEMEDDEEGDEGEGREEEKHSERRVPTAKRKAASSDGDAEDEDEDEEEEKKGPPAKCRAHKPLPYSSSAASVRGLQDESLVTQLQESLSRAWDQVDEYKEQLAQSREDIKALREDLKEQRDENKALRVKAQQLAAVLKTAQASVAVTPSNAAAAAAAAAMDIAVGGDDLLH